MSGTDQQERRQRGAVGNMLARAQWSARCYAGYNAESVRRITQAVARAGEEAAEKYARWAVEETGFGVAEHKVIKNRACSTGLLQAYGDLDLVTPRVDTARKIVEIPRPAGVVFALTPSTNPIATVYFKVLLALMTRNAVLVSPHPGAAACCADAARVLGDAAEAAGAPSGIVQCIDQPSVPLIEAVMADRRTSVIVATGGTAVVRAAYSSGTPALGVGPGNVPVFVDDTADIDAAARRIVDSKAFDNSVLCTNESVLIMQRAVADRLQVALCHHGAAILDEAGAARLRTFMFPAGTLNTAVVGKPATWIAQQAGITVPARTKVLIAPVRLVADEEPLTHEKLSPVLGMVTVDTREQGMRAAHAVVRIAGAGHSAAIHSTDPASVLAFSTAVPVLRVAVNVGNSTGSAGLETNLAPSMTIGTGFIGNSGLGSNLRPDDLINTARVAYNSDPGEVMPSFAGMDPWHSPAGPVPAYPQASNEDAGTSDPAGQAGAITVAVPPEPPELAELRESIRQLVAEELASALQHRERGF